MQITQAEREQRIKQLLHELEKFPPEQHETRMLPWPGKELYCKVIRMSVDEVVLNPNSHRIRAQLRDDPRWESLSDDPFSPAAQRLIEEKVRLARSPEDFAALVDSLAKDGQTEPGVITYKGLLVNANTRVVALRGVDDPDQRYIRVAVLPETAQPHEMSLLELRLQMQKDLKVDYSMTNELLFIEELFEERHMSEAQIAQELRIHPESAKKGENEVRMRLQMLDLIRTMQKLPAEPLKLTFFDDPTHRISYQHLKDLLRTYQGLLNTDPVKARKHLESFLLSVSVGVTAVHQIRRVDGEFMSRYMLPHLEENEVVGNVAEKLVTSDGGAGEKTPSGVDALRVDDDHEEPGAVDVGKLIHLVTRRDKDVKLAKGNVVIAHPQEDVKGALKEAILNGISDKKRDEQDADKLAAPTKSVKDATRDLTKAGDALSAVASDPDFDDQHRKTLEAAFKKLTRVHRDLESTLIKAGVLRK